MIQELTKSLASAREELDREIKRRMQVEEELRSSEARYRSFVEHFQGIAFQGRMDFTPVFFVGMVEEITGYTREEFEAGNPRWNQVIHPKDLPIVVETGKKLRSVPNHSIEREYRIIRKDGEIRWIHEFIRNVCDDADQPVLVQGAVYDVTTRKETEQALLESEQELRDREEQFRTILDYTYDWEYWIGPDGRHIYASPSCERITGYPSEAFMKDPGLLLAIAHADDREMIAQHVGEELQHGEAISLDYRIITRDGKERWVSHLCQPVFDCDGRFRGRRASNRDITERKRVENLLRESEAKYSALIENARDGILFVQDGTIRFANRALAELTGYSVDELIDLPVSVLITPDHRNHVLDRYTKRMRGEEVPALYCSKALCKDGTIKDIEISAEIIDYRGKPADMGIVRDITERKRAEEELLSLKARLEYVLTVSPAIIFSCEVQADYRGTFVSKNVKDQLGYDPEEFLAGPDFWAARIHPEDAPRVFDEAAAFVKNGGGTTDYRFRLKDGAYKWMRSQVKIIRNAAGEPVEMVGFWIDITEQKRLEEELLKAQKLESVGRLAGGIAHDFNNLLMGILGNVALAKVQQRLEFETLELLNQAEKAALRAKHLTGQLLTFARGGAPIKKTVSLPRLLREVTGFALRGSNVRAEFAIPEDMWLVEADEGQISQVIHNLVVNAQQAMPEGGIVMVEGLNLEAEAVAHLSLKAGEYLRISVIDSGVGIPEDLLPKVFDPYFTTKEKGHGLGLAIAYSIVEKHGGHIEIKSRPGTGTTCHVYLPASPVQAHKRMEERTPQAVAPPLHKEGGRILLMDDEETVRKVAGEILCHLGYEVVPARNSEEAIEKYEEARIKGSPFDVVILDLTVSGGPGGKETMQRLLKTDPAVKAILSSGYIYDPVIAQYDRYGFRGVITKPYDIEELRRTLQEVMAQTDQ